MRCVHEASCHAQNSFLTLTYRDPAPERLEKEDLQRFFKRLRKAVGKLRYFACGEYGERTKRPHFHALIFGHDFLDGSYRTGMGPKSPNEYYVNPLISDVWGNGHVTIAPCEPASVFYVCGYSLKNLGDPDCFHMCSRRPYIGAGWLREHHDDLVRNGFVTVDGVKHSPPASYLRRAEADLEMDELRARRAERVRQMGAEALAQRSLKARDREINYKAAAARRRGDL